MTASAPTTSAPRVAAVDDQTLRQLHFFARLVDEVQYSEAFAQADELLAAPHEGFVPVENDLYGSLRRVVYRKLSSLPAQALETYRRRIDLVAEPWLQQGIAQRDERLLQRVVDQALLSSWGDEALAAVGEIALERGDSSAARRHWSRLPPFSSDGAVVAYSDASRPRADVWARMALASIRAGDFTTAETEIGQLADQFPEARGRLGGRQVDLAERLAALNDAARSLRTKSTAVPSYELAWSIELDEPRADYPAIVTDDEAVYFTDAAGVHALRIDDGQPLLPQRSLLLPKPTLHRGSDADANTGGIHESGLALQGRLLYASYPHPIRSASQSAGRQSRSQLVAVDLARQGAVEFEAPALPPGESVISAPVVDADYVVVVTASVRQTLRYSTVCLDRWSGQLVWRRELGAVALPSSATPRRTKASLTLHSGLVFVNTNAGMIAAFRAADGQPMWLRTYQRTSLPNGVNASTDRNAAQRRMLLTTDRVVVASADSSEVMAIRLSNGRLDWAQPLPAPDAHLLTAIDGRIVLSGQRMWSFDASTGRLDSQWGADLDAAAGVGVESNGVIIRPTDRRIEILDAATCRPVGSPLETPGGKVCLFAAGVRSDVLITAGANKISVYREKTMEDDAMPAQRND